MLARRFPNSRRGEVRTALRKRRGGVLVMVLIIMVAVALLASQGLRLMMLSHQAHEQHWKSAQIGELIELGRLRLAQFEQSEAFTVEVPETSGSATRRGHISIQPRTAGAEGWRITIRYPYEHPNETTVTWESP